MGFSRGKRFGLNDRIPGGLLVVPLSILVTLFLCLCSLSLSVFSPPQRWCWEEERHGPPQVLEEPAEDGEGRWAVDTGDSHLLMLMDTGLPGRKESQG